MPVDITLTLIEVAPATTWWLVTTSPSDVRTMPVPAASPPLYRIVVAMRTRPLIWEPDAVVVDSVPCPGRLPEPPEEPSPNGRPPFGSEGTGMPLPPPSAQSHPFGREPMSGPFDVAACSLPPVAVVAVVPFER